MNRKAFFDALRVDTRVFGTQLTEPQVQGIESILDAAIRYGVRDAHYVSQILANVVRETGSYMMPIKETVFSKHKNKNPTDKTVIKRLDNAWAKGQLTWVRTPYWRDGAFGRGQLQITHHTNYLKMGTRLGKDLTTDYNAMLDLETSADAAVIGMMEGMFRGRKLSDYSFPSCLENTTRKTRSKHPRRIVNGIDDTASLITTYHWAFYDAFKAAGGWSLVQSEPEPEPNITTEPVISKDETKQEMNIVAAIMYAILEFIRRLRQ